MATLLLRGGIVDGRRQDVAIRDGRIHRVGDALDTTGYEVIDVRDSLVLP
ncbi:MAG: amidohydrolase, partial [Candidatus Rokubacteria bacterium]|nr:amidohydrolase [Candidatus Rokubacteria bacterium]